MTHLPYRTLLGAALAALLVGAAIAQTTSDDPARLPASKDTPQSEQTQPADAPTDKMKGQSDAQAPVSDQTGSKAPASDKAKSKVPASDKADSKTSASDQSDKNASAAKTSKPAKQASKSRTQPVASPEPAEKAFRQALRQCAREPQQSQRDTCLDSAIEQFQRG